MNMTNRIVEFVENAANLVDENIRWARNKARENHIELIRGSVLDPDNHPGKKS